MILHPSRMDALYAPSRGVRWAREAGAVGLVLIAVYLVWGFA